MAKTIELTNIREYYTKENFLDVSKGLCDGLDRDVEQTAEDLARIAQAYGWSKDETDANCTANSTAMFGIIEDGNLYDPEEFKVDGYPAIMQYGDDPMRECPDIILDIETALSDALASRVTAMLKEVGDEYTLNAELCPEYDGTAVMEMWLVKQNKDIVQCRTYRSRDGFEDYVGFRQLPLALQDAAMRSLAKTVNQIFAEDQ